MRTHTKKCGVLLLAFLLSLPFTKLQAQEQEEQKQSRFFYGGGVAVALGGYLNIDVSPRVGYRLTPNLSVGVLAKYEYINDKRSGVEPYQANIYGGGTFVQYNVSSLISSTPLPFDIYVHTEYQHLYATFSWKNYSYTTNDTRDRWFVGGGFAVPLGKQSVFYTTIMYDILAIIKNKGDEYSNKPIVSVGVQF